jgi:hypothetical protein
MARQQHLAILGNELVEFGVSVAETRIVEVPSSQRTGAADPGR